MENKLIIFLLLFILSCHNNDKIVINDKSITKTVKYSPDICLNKFILMTEIKSFGDEKLVNDYLFCKNKNENEFLAMTPNYGGVKNKYRLFRVFRKEQFKTYPEFKNLDIINVNFKQLNEESFISESQIKLGMDKSNLILKKGSDYTTEEVNNNTRIVYRIFDYKNSDLLQKYNMPEYKSEYLFDENNKLIQFNFGFTMP